MRVDGAGAQRGPHAPHVAEELLLREDPVRLTREARGEVELAPRERDGPATDAHLPRAPVDHDVVSFEDVGLPVACATQERSHARHELEVEMPLDDVVRSLLERPHPCHRVGSGLGEEDHRHIAIPAPARLSLPQAATELRLGGDHDVRRRPLRKIERPGAPRRLEHAEAVVAQVPLQVAPRLRLGLGEEDGARRHDAEARAVSGRPPDVHSARCVTIRPHVSVAETIEELTVQADGLRMHALAAGPADGPLVVLLHGFPELARSWRRQLPALAAAGYRAVAPDQRGYGETELRGPYDASTLARDVIELVRALGRDRVSLVGHDWGGAVAWTAAREHPEVVERLVALNCPPPDVLSHALRSSLRQLRRSWYMAFFQLPWLPERRMTRDGAAVVGRALVGGSHNRAAWSREEVASYRAAFSRPGRAKAAIDWYRTAFRRSLVPRRRRARPRVSAPTLVLWGMQDRFLGVELIERAKLSRVLAPGNEPEIVLIEEAGHFVQNEAAERVNVELLRWLGPAS